MVVPGTVRFINKVIHDGKINATLSSGLYYPQGNVCEVQAYWRCNKSYYKSSKSQRIVLQLLGWTSPFSITSTRHVICSLSHVCQCSNKTPSSSWNELPFLKKDFKAEMLSIYESVINYLWMYWPAGLLKTLSARKYRFSLDWTNRWISKRIWCNM